MKQFIGIIAFVTLWVGMVPTASSAERLWSDHAPPYTFLFGNHIDTHQETWLVTNSSLAFLGIKKGDLLGYLYIFWVDADGDGITDTTEAGLPIAEHCVMPEHYAAGCFAGWLVHAKPCITEVNACRAMFLYHGHDHPVWLLGPHLHHDTSGEGMSGEGTLRGSRLDVVQPGSFTHIHWLTSGATHTDDTGMMMHFPSSLEAVEDVFETDIHVPEACNVAMAENLTTGAICPGYFIQLIGTKAFALRHGGELIAVKPGIDNKTHLNLLTDYQAVDVPLDGLPGGDGGHDH
jgi:hypothetical protein